jgi:hypothetical protein
MGTADKRADEATIWRGRRERLRLECRECEVICERVIYPWQCLRSKCECIYSYQDQDTMYFGCLHKVFAPELDLAAFSEGAAEVVTKRPSAASPPAQSAQVAPRKRGRVKATDPYGPIRATRTPRPQCRVRVEQAYDAASARNCCNPTFFHHPSAPAEDAMRLTAKCSDEGAVGNDGDPGVPS